MSVSLLMLSQHLKKAEEEGRVLSVTIHPGKITEMLSQYQMLKELIGVNKIHVKTKDRGEKVI